MNFYDLAMKPLEKKVLGNLRKELIPSTYGETLEIGIGTGANLKYYDYKKISSITGLDVRLSSAIRQKTCSQIKLTEGTAESLPFENNRFDTVVGTLVLCSVGDLDKSLREIQRVLKVNGKYVFIEHVLPESKRLSSAFCICNGMWKAFTHGCNINRATDTSIRSSGLNILSMKKTGGILCFGAAQKL